MGATYGRSGRDAVASDAPSQAAADLADAMAPLPVEDRIRLVEATIAGRLVFTTSLGLEDQVLTRAIASVKGRTEIVTLDTGRLFAETYDVWAETEALYHIRIRAYAPDRDAAEAFVAREGINGFRGSLDARQACCGLRKVEPLTRALSGASAWLTGLRAGQSAARAHTPLVEADEARGLLKVNPLADWTRAAVAAFAHDHAVPYNVLHDRGFPSVGCAPCTRAVRVGEDERAGRWWWEREAKKECGLHLPAAAIAPGEEAMIFEPASGAGARRSA